MKRILVPVDGSSGACNAAAFAARLAKGTGATVELMYVYDAPTVAAVGMHAASDLRQIKADVADGSFQQALTAISGAVGGGEIAIAEYVTIGHPVQEICGYAKEQRHDMIVMGNRGRSKMAELLLGSVSHQVLHHAPCPVLIVR